jgi:hypothetical protein
MCQPAALLTVYCFRLSRTRRARVQRAPQILTSEQIAALILFLALLLSVPRTTFAQNIILNNGQAGQPLDEATNALIQRARNRVLDSMRRAPRYTCTETIERHTFDSRRETHSCETRSVGDKLAAQDRLRLDVAVTQNSEIFSWHGEKQFAEGEIGDLVSYGMIGSGLFSSFLAGIFGDSRYLSRFGYVGSPIVDGELLAEYEFVMPAAASHWLMRAGSAHVIAPYHGSVWVDPNTAGLRHIHIVADDLPPELQTCSVDVDLRYHIIQLGSNEFVIPESAVTSSTGPSGIRSVSETKFLQCHEFLGESTLHFDSTDEAATPATAVPVAPETKDLPSGLHFAVDLETSIDINQSWVGDPIVGRLKDTIKLSNEVLAPKGSKVVGRLVALRTSIRPDERLEVGFNWQQIEVGSATILRLRAEFTDPLRDVTYVSRGRRGSIGVPMKTEVVAVEGRPFVFALAGSHKTLPRNLTTDWITVPLPKETAKPESSGAVR